MKVKIVEVGPRDGLQNENLPWSLEQKIEFIRRLIAAGHSHIEVGAFVNPAKVPQMAASRELCTALSREFPEPFNSASKKKTNLHLSALVPNSRGFDDALAVGMRDIAVFTAASETFNQRNINASINESLERFKEFLPRAKASKMFIRGYVSTCFGCPYEGEVAPKKVLQVTEKLLKLGVHEVSIGDTIGVADPIQVKKLTRSLLKLVGSKRLALHFHDTRGTALANILAGLEEGVRIFDSSAGGLGGCPYAPGAAGNVATDDLLYMLHRMGIETGIDLNKHVHASEFAQRILDRVLPSRYLQASIR